MKRYRTLITGLAIGCLGGYIFAAAPNYAAFSNTANGSESAAAPSPQILAQASTAQEQQLLQQIEADAAKLRADENAERAQQKPINPDVPHIRASLENLAQALRNIAHVSHAHYEGHWSRAEQAIMDAHNQLMACYRIASSH